MSKYSFPPKTKFFLGTAYPDGTFGKALSPRVYKEEFGEVLLDFWEFISPKDDNKESHTYYILPQDFIDDFAQTIRNNFRTDLETFYTQLKTDDINNLYRRFETRDTVIIQGKYKDDAEALASDCNNVVRYQKELFLKTQSTLLKKDQYNQPVNSPVVLSNINDVYANFVVMRNLYGISLLVDANTKYFKENTVFKDDFEEIEAYILQLLQSDSKRLNEALCWSILNDLELVHRYENVSGKKISDEERQNIIKGNIYIPGEWSFGAGPWNNGSSNYQMVNLNLSDTWVAHYLQILQMLVEIRYLKAIHKSLLTRYEAQFDKDVVQDPGFEQTLYLAKDIFTSAIPILKPQ